MKIAVFSDIHGNYQALRAILDDINKRKIDKVICLGDTIGIGPNSSECLDLLIKNNVETVLGNHELYYLYGTEIDDEMSDNEKKHHSWIRSLITENQKQYLIKSNLSITKNVDGKRFLFEHFALLQNGNDYPFYDLKKIKTGKIKDLYKYDIYDYIFFGHEHKACEFEVDNKKIVDVGSSGCVKDNSTYYTMINIEDGLEIKKVELLFNRNEFENALIKTRYPEREILSKIFFGVEMH